jgi:hydroxyacylglutathione hydrolase
MIQIHALPAFSDNYIWLLHDELSNRCAVVDPGDAGPVLLWLEQHQCHLETILVTHHHKDHTGGVSELKRKTGAKVAGPRNERIADLDILLGEGDEITALGHAFRIFDVPGHTSGHIAFHAMFNSQSTLFPGDTLFAAGCGRLFEGTSAQMHESLQKLASLSDDTRIYCAHEYTLSNLRFAVAVEPENSDIQARLAQVTEWREKSQISLPSSLALERLTNPFLRSDQQEVRKRVEQKNQKTYEAESSVFAALRAWKDEF